MPASFGCPWCGTANADVKPGFPFCYSCLHRVDMPKEQCDCPMCDPLPRPLPVPVKIPDVPDVPDVPEIDHDELLQRVTFGKLDTLMWEFLNVDGRHFQNPMVAYSIRSSSVVLRIDDISETEHWVEIVISDTMIENWIRKMIAIDDAPNDPSGVE